jgi:hypothetical protein
MEHLYIVHCTVQEEKYITENTKGRSVGRSVPDMTTIQSILATKTPAYIDRGITHQTQHFLR